MDQSEAKRRAGTTAIEFVSDGMTVGLGTGSTAGFAVEELGRRVARGLRVRAVPTSEATAELARRAGIPLVDLESIASLDLTVDGADEITADGSAIKGGGGALCREKVVAAATRGSRVAVVDASKLVDRLGSFPIAVEVVPFARAVVSRWVAALGGEPRWRAPGGSAFVTDNGNHILDCKFGPRSDWSEVSRRLDAIPGLVCHGIFLHTFDVIVIGTDTGTEIRHVLRAPGSRELPPL